MEESKNSQLIGEFINQFYDEEISKNSIKLNKDNITAFRITGKTQKIGNEFFHKAVSYFERATHIFPKYKKIQWTIFNYINNLINEKLLTLNIK